MKSPIVRSIRPVAVHVFAPAVAATCLLLCAALLPGGHLLQAARAQSATADSKPASTPARQQVLLPSAGEAGKDLPIDLPAWPEERDLAELKQGVRPDLRFFVDRRSIERVPGGEFRYTFVVHSTSGARNVTFEMMKCNPRERMILALGSPDRRWSPARFLRWEPIDRNDPAGMREVLYRDIFCPDRQPVASIKAALTALKTGLATRELSE